jgi:hypothetical protein
MLLALSVAVLTALSRLLAPLVMLLRSEVSDASADVKLAMSELERRTDSRDWTTLLVNSEEGRSVPVMVASSEVRDAKPESVARDEARERKLLLVRRPLTMEARSCALAVLAAAAARRSGVKRMLMVCVW